MKKSSLFLLLSIVLLIFSSCTIKKWEPPEWDVTLEIPVINERVFMHELEDTTETYIIRMDNDTLFFSMSEDIESKNVGDELKVDGKTETIDKEIGDELEIAGRDESFSVSVGDELNISGQSQYFERALDKIEVEETGSSDAKVYVLAFADSAVGGGGVGPIINTPIPPLYGFPPIDTSFSVFENDNIEYVVIDSGFAYIDFKNNTDIPLSSTNPTYFMRLEIYSGAMLTFDDPIIMHKIDHIIAANATEHIELDLSGAQVFQDNYLRIFLTTDGTGGQAINVFEEDNFYVTFSVSEMIVSEASAKLPEERITHDESISIEDAAEEISLVSATIDSCLGHIRVDNDLPIDAHVTINFIELLDDTGNPFEATFDIDGSSTQNDFPLNFENFQIVSTREDVIDSLHFSYNVVTDATDDYVTISEDMVVSTEIEFGKMKFREVTGYLVQTFTQNDTLSLADATDKILLDEADIRSGMMNINISGISFDPQISIIFDEIEDQFHNPVHITNEDFSGYSFTDHKVLDQVVHYHVEVDMPVSELITVSSSDVVNADIHLSELIFESVIGKFNSMTIEDEKAVEVDSTGEYSLCFAEIDSCDVHVSIPAAHYTLPFVAHIRVKFHEIFDATGDTLILNLSCPGDTMISFADHTIGDDPFSSSLIDSLHYSYIVTTEPTTGYVTVYYEDEVRAEIELSEMIFNSVKGIIDHKHFEMDDIEEDLDIEDLPDSIANVMMFQNAELHLDVYNETGFNCWLNIDMIGSNPDGDTAIVHIDETSGVVLPNQMNHVVITEGVSEMLSIVPTHVSATNPYAIIGNGFTIGEITKNDSISGSYTIETPFKFIINAQTVTLSELEHKEFNEDTRNMISDNLDGVLLNLTAENLLPFGTYVEFWFAADSTQVWTNPELVIDSFYVESATIDPVHHTSEEVVVSNIEIELTHEHGDFSVFENPDVYVGIKLPLIGTGGEVVIVRGSDNLRIFGYVSVDVHVKEVGGEK